MKQSFSFAKRDNNPRRDYLLINKFQSKHFPSDPVDTVRRFSDLGKKVKAAVGSARCLVIGFSETAVGVGAYIARALGADFVSTTRELLPECFERIGFEEVHSHATSHSLCVRSELFSDISALVVADDEFTTGNTAVNLVKCLDGIIPDNCAVYAASFAASRESRDFFMENGITPLFEICAEDIERLEFPDTFNPDHAVQPKAFDMLVEENSILDFRIGASSEELFAEYERLCVHILSKSEKILERAKTISVVGTEENCVIPIVLGEMLADRGFDVTVQGVTRSPILPADADGYPMRIRAKLSSLYDENRTVYLYNAPECDVAFVLTDAEKPAKAAEEMLCGALFAEKTVLVRQRAALVPTSILKNDGIVLLKDITGRADPLPSVEREKLIRSGVHYSELLPAEYEPSPEYLRLYESGLEQWAGETARAVASISEQIYAKKGRNAVIVSLARAGTPVGVLIVRYLRRKYGFTAAHYSISIIRGRGVDKNALRYILARHSPEDLQFVDGWTGKGAISSQLSEALEDFPEIDPTLGVLADPAGVCELCGTHDDVFIPCSCLNSVVSGLFSRSFLRGDLIGEDDFHGAAYFSELAAGDRTYDFIERVEREFGFDGEISPVQPCAAGCGLEEARKIAAEFGVADINLVKPSIGETTRVLLRRIPRVILLQEKGSVLTAHIEELAAEKGVRVEEYPLNCYRAVGIISNEKLS